MKTRNLPCKLSSDERAERLAAMGKILQAIEIAEETKKAITKKYASEIETHSAALRALGRVARSGEEEREVEIREERDFAKGVKRIIRVDTGAVVESIPLTPADRQGSLPLKKDEPQLELVEPIMCGHPQSDAPDAPCCILRDAHDGDHDAGGGRTWDRDPSLNPPDPDQIVGLDDVAGGDS